MSTKIFRETCGDFDVVGLRSNAVEVAVVPQVGAKIIRLRDCCTNREWAWSPDPARGLWRNAVGDRFDDSPLVGVDECIPTVAPCTVDGREWPDHGEAWCRPWQLDEHALRDARVVTAIRLETAPLLLQRELGVTGNTLRIAYSLQNLRDQAQRYAWALHPLLSFREGDRIELPPGAYAGRVDSVANLPGLASDQVAAWPEPVPGAHGDRLLSGTEGTSLKLYLPSPQAGELAITNAQEGTTMRVRYGPVNLLPHLGIWVTRGGWNGHHHFAVEPTNVADDRADRIEPGANPAAVLGPGQQRHWFVQLAFGS